MITEIINLSTFIGARGYPFFLACLYIGLVLLLSDVGLSVLVGWSVQNNRLDFSWWVGGWPCDVVIRHQGLYCSNLTGLSRMVGVDVAGGRSFWGLFLMVHNL